MLIASLVLPAASLAAGTAASPSSTATANDLERLVLATMNQDRASLGLVPYRSWGALGSIAHDRAQRMAAANTMSHAVAGGDLGPVYAAKGIQTYGWGDIIGTSTYPWGSEAILNIYGLWKNSRFHWPLMISADFNYTGVGVAQASNGATYVAVVFSESDDHTAPIARNGAISRTGTTISFRWSGTDPLLQTHTAGLASFDLIYRVDGGAWRMIRNDTTATSISIANRLRGHTYSFRVRATDKGGTLSAWTREIRISIP